MAASARADLAVRGDRAGVLGKHGRQRGRAENCCNICAPWVINSQVLSRGSDPRGGAHARRHQAQGTCAYYALVPGRWLSMTFLVPMTFLGSHEDFFGSHDAS
eukprot:gene16157-biopygen21773